MNNLIVLGIAFFAIGILIGAFITRIAYMQGVRDGYQYPWLKHVQAQIKRQGLKRDVIHPKENLQELYVDHLVTDLEKRSIGAILDFLAKYCGWDEIYAYVHNKYFVDVIK